MRNYSVAQDRNTSEASLVRKREAAYSIFDKVQTKTNFQAEINNDI